MKIYQQQVLLFQYLLQIAEFGATNYMNITQIYTENGSSWLSQAGPTEQYYRGWWTNPENNSEYYFRLTSGSMVTGRQFIDGHWMYFRNSGTLATGWQKIGTAWKYYRLDTEIILFIQIRTGIVDNIDIIIIKMPINCSVTEYPGENLSICFIISEELIYPSKSPNTEPYITANKKPNSKHYTDKNGHIVCIHRSCCICVVYIHRSND